MTENTTNQVDDNTLKAHARSAAEKRLRDNNREEFAAYMEEEHTKRGVEWSPRLTEAEKAQRRIIEDAKKFGIDLGALAEEVTVEAALDAAPLVDYDAEVETRRAAAAEALFGGQHPLTER